MAGSMRGKTAWLLLMALAIMVPAGAGPSQAADGALDLFFDGDGANKFGWSPGTSTERGYDVAVQASGRILVVGWTEVSAPGYGGDEINVFGLKRDGSLDTDFGLSGASRVGTAGGDYGYAIALQPDGKIVVAGERATVEGSDMLVCRLKPRGAVDRTFGVNGCRRVDFGGVEQAFDVAIQGDGKIVLVGQNSGNVAVARLTAAGKLDTRFSGDGKATFDIFGLGGNDVARAVAIQRDGKIVIAGHTDSTGSDDFLVIRLTRNGSLDTTFSDDGIATMDFFDGRDEAFGVAIQPDGGIVAAGSAYFTGFADYDFGLVRWDSSGNEDPTFGTVGKSAVHFGTGSANDFGRDLVILKDGRIVVGGFSNVNGLEDFALAWIKPDGYLDASLSGNGMFTTDPEGDGVYDTGRGMALQKDGRILLAGLSKVFADDFAVARYMVDLPYNGGFERDFDADGAADVWRGVRLKAGDGRDCAGGHGGSCSYRLSARNARGRDRKAVQWTGAAGKKNDMYDVSLWSSADGADGRGKYEVQVMFKYRDGTKGTFQIRPNRGTHGWEESTGTITAARAYKNMKVTILYGKTAGTVLFDDITVTPRQ